MQDFNPRVPSAARMYDYALGGKDNFEADRKAADEIREKRPDAFAHARDNREFLKRAVRWAATSGVDQFIDIGSGLPTAVNTHEIAQASNEGARVAYVDNDPVVVKHAEVLVKGDHRVMALSGDLRDPAAILGNRELRELIYFDRPVAIVLVAVLHFLRDPQAHEAVNAVKQAIPPRSCLIISHATGDHADGDTVKAVQGAYDRTTSPLVMRTLHEVTQFFDGLDLVGEVGDVSAWWNPSRQARTGIACYGGVAVKPG